MNIATSGWVNGEAPRYKASDWYDPYPPLFTRAEIRKINNWCMKMRQLRLKSVNA